MYTVPRSRLPEVESACCIYTGNGNVTRVLILYTRKHAAATVRVSITTDWSIPFAALLPAAAAFDHRKANAAHAWLTLTPRPPHPLIVPTTVFKLIAVRSPPHSQYELTTADTDLFSAFFFFFFTFPVFHGFISRLYTTGDRFRLNYLRLLSPAVRIAQMIVSQGRVPVIVSGPENINQAAATAMNFFFFIY